MNFRIEKISIRKNENEPKKDIKINITEREKSIRNFCETVLILDQKIGEGNFSNVFKDTIKNRMCYKRYKPGAENRMNITVTQEADFLKSVYGIHDKVQTPYLVAVANVVKKNNNTGELSQEKIIAMQHFYNSTNLEEALDKKNRSVIFPNTFNPKEFFAEINNFIEEMHKRGIYHRDLAPRNILIDNDTGLPIIIDFGDAAYQPLDDRFDAYGRRNNGKNEDLDLKQIRQAENLVLSLLEIN